MRESETVRKQKAAELTDSLSKTDGVETSNLQIQLDSLPKALLEEAAAGGKSDFIRVDASPQQISGAIASLRRSPQSFPAVTIAGPEEKRLFQNSLPSENLRGAGQPAVVNQPLPTPAASNADAPRIDLRRAETAQQDRLQSATATDDAKKAGVPPGRARRLLASELNRTAATDALADGKPDVSAQKLKFDAHDKESSSLDASKPAAAAGEASENSPPMPAGNARAKQTPPNQSGGARAFGGAGGGFGGGNGRGGGDNGFRGGGGGGKFKPQASDESAREVATPATSENHQRALFVLRIVDTPPAAAAVAPGQAGPSQVNQSSTQPGNTPANAPQAPLAKPPVGSK